MMDASGETPVMVWKAGGLGRGLVNIAGRRDGKGDIPAGVFLRRYLEERDCRRGGGRTGGQSKESEEYEKKCMEIAQGWGDYLGCSVATVNISGIYSEKADNDAEAYGIDPAVWEGMTKDKELNWYNISAVYRDEKGNEAGYLFDFNSDTGEYYVEPFY